MRTFHSARGKTFQRLSDSPSPTPSPSMTDNRSYMLQDVRPADPPRSAAGSGPSAERTASTATTATPAGPDTKDRDRKGRDGHGNVPPVHVVQTAEPEDWKAGRQEKLIVSTLMAISFLTAIDSSIFMCALGALARALNGTEVETFWVGNAFLLANAVFLPVIGSLADIIGRRELTMSSLIIFTVGTIVCCVSKNFTQLIAGRTVQGIGGGGINAMSSVILTDIIPLRQRPKFQGMVLVAWALGTMAGPAVGGAIAEHADWRWLFYINYPFCAFGMVVVPLTVKIKAKERFTFVQKLQRIDWIGSLLFIGGTSTFLMGITWGGTEHPWGDIVTWGPILFGGLGVVAAILYEVFVAGKLLACKPFLPLSLFKNVTASVVFFLSMWLGISLFVPTWYIPFYLESVKGLGPTETGAVYLCVNALTFPTGFVTGIVIAKRGTFRWALWTGWVACTVGFCLFLLLKPSINVAGTIFLCLIVGLGAGMLLITLNIASQVAVGDKDAAYAVALYTFMRNFGAALGIAIATAAFDNRMQAALEDRGYSSAAANRMANQAQWFTDQLAAMPAGPEKTGLVDSYVEGFRGVWYVIIAVAAFGTLLCGLVRHHSLDRKLDSDHKLEGAAGAAGSTSPTSDEEASVGLERQRPKI